MYYGCSAKINGVLCSKVFVRKWYKGIVFFYFIQFSKVILIRSLTYDELLFRLFATQDIPVGQQT